MSITINGSGTITGSDRAASAIIVGKNKLINPNFAVNQRAVTGTVVLTAGQYGHDRWKAGSGGCTYTFSTSANITTITISVGTLVQVIEGLNLYSGTHTLSWVGTAQGRVDAGAYGASGLTATATGGTNQSIEFGTGTVSRVQYEDGSVATTFERRSYGFELALCQRYYEAICVGGSVPLVYNYSITPNIISNCFNFSVLKRATPTVTVYGAGGTAGTVEFVPSGGGGSDASVTVTARTNLFFLSKGGSTGAGYLSMYSPSNANAEL